MRVPSRCSVLRVCQQKRLMRDRLPRNEKRTGQGHLGRTTLLTLAANIAASRHEARDIRS
jgi:hypothetical protein